MMDKQTEKDESQETQKIKETVDYIKGLNIPEELAKAEAELKDKYQAFD